MNVKDLLIFAGVAVGAYMLLKRKDMVSLRANEIENNALPGQSGYGWRYFTDGTAISPDGTYYYKGQMVYQASYDGVSVGANYSNLT